MMIWVAGSTMGYGDILPVTTAERQFSIFVAVTGAVVFSYCMGTISALIDVSTGVEDRCRGRLQASSRCVRGRAFTG